MAYGLGEKALDPGSSAITITKLAVGVICIVSCIAAAAFLVPG